MLTLRKYNIIIGSEAVSEVIAIVLLVAIAVGIAVPIFIFSNQASVVSETPIAISLDLDYSESNKQLIITNIGGDKIDKAFASDGLSWNNMNVAIYSQSGEPPNLVSITGCQNFSSGCKIKATYDEVIPEDSSISITYVPADQLILNEELSDII